MNKDRATRISKYLSLVLRHNPAAAGVTLDEEGWVRVEDLLAGAARHGHFFTRAELEEVVQKSEKQRMDSVSFAPQTVFGLRSTSRRNTSQELWSEAAYEFWI